MKFFLNASKKVVFALIGKNCKKFQILGTKQNMQPVCFCISFSKLALHKTVSLNRLLPKFLKFKCITTNRVFIQCQLISTLSWR